MVSIKLAAIRLYSRREITLKIGIPKEVMDGETRVAVVPSMLTPLIRDKHEVFVEAGCGTLAAYSDEQYQNAGATILEAEELYRNAQVICKVNPPGFNPQIQQHETQLFQEGSTFIGFTAPFANRQVVEDLATRNITTFAMEYVPRITRAQSMDALSSMATVAGYRAVIEAAHRIGKFFPLLMTAAGTVPPATVLVLGVGVAGLQAIATAKRLGAKVEAFDPRPAVKDQVESLGATFVEMELPEEEVATAQGYAKQQSDEFLRKEQEAIAARLPKVHVVITTAQIFGKQAPLLITEKMVRQMRPGSVIIDLAADQGGNCELTKPRQYINYNDVGIFGAVNLPATMPVDASMMYSKNITSLLRHIYKEDSDIDFADEIIKGACITRNGEIVNDMIKNAYKGE